MMNPYVGPRTFTQAESHLFFGREQEARDLFSRVISERLLLFYATSGAGKSSLLQTRLMPKLQEQGWIVLPVARLSGALPTGIAHVPNIYRFNLMLSLDRSQRDPQRLVDLSLAQFLRQLSSDDGESFYYDETEAETASSTTPYILIIDQFEELLTTHAPLWPHRAEFLRELNETLRADSMLSVLLTLREDYVAALDPYAQLLDNSLRARFYMTRMGYEAALTAVTEPAKVGQRPFTADAARQLVANLSQVKATPQKLDVSKTSDFYGGGGGGQFIEPVQLQVVCFQLWEKLVSATADRAPEAITVADLERYGNVDNALASFYEQVLRQVLPLYPQVAEAELRQWFDQQLITPAQTRGLVFQGQHTAGMPNELVQALSSAYLLRTDQRAGGQWVELVHDRFIEPILQANQAWHEERRQQNPLLRAAQTWKDVGKKNSYLYLGPQLKEVLIGLNRQNLDTLTQEFLTKCEEIQQQQELMETKQKLSKLEYKKDLSQAGWGLIFPATTSFDTDKHSHYEAVKEALKPLIELRQQQAGDRFKIFEGDNGFRPNEKLDSFLIRNDVAISEADFKKVPYYLLLIGSPEDIPWEFQYGLDIGYGVGRIYFEMLEDYAIYAHHVVQNEVATLMRDPSFTFFSPQHANDKPTKMSLEYLVAPLAMWLQMERPHWQVNMITEYATKEKLLTYLYNYSTILFFSGYGLEFPNGDLRQLKHQGALLCADWPGSREWRSKSIPPGFYFSGDDMTTIDSLFGSIVILLSSFTVGTPQKDNFYFVRGSEKVRAIAPHSFIAQLPQKMLVKGALAVIGHVDRIWGYSYIGVQKSQTINSKIDHFKNMLYSLTEEYPVGAAMDFINQRYAQFAAILANILLEEADYQPREVVSLKTLTLDARNYVVLGDPAVRLRLK